MSEESKMEEVNKRRRKTRNEINNVNKNILGIVNEVIRERPTNESHVESNSFLEALNEQEADIIKLNEHTEDLLLDNEGELSAEMENSILFTLKVKKCKQKLKSFLDMKVYSEAQQAAHSQNTEDVKTGFELPKLVLKTFSRYPLEWNQFRETYEAVIYQNNRISNAQKFSHLINYLAGSAKQAVGGFPVTNEANEEAFTLLKNRYVNPRLIISVHVNNFTKLE